MFINAIIDTIQKFSARRAATAHQELVMTLCRILHDGGTCEPDTRELFPGDRISANNYPDITICTRGYDKVDNNQLLKASTKTAISDMLEASPQTGGEVLTAMVVFEDDAAELIGSFRTE